MPMRAGRNITSACKHHLFHKGTTTTTRIPTPSSSTCRRYCSTTKTSTSNNTSTKNNNFLWNFLWGANTPKQTTPEPITNILEYKIKASEVSLFEYVFVNTQEKLEATIRHLQKHKLLGVDCEGVGLSREGKLCLLQIATDKDVFLIDVVALGASSFTTGIGAMLEDTEITKIMHDCRTDSDALFHQYSIKLAGVYDVQIAHSLYEKKKKWEKKRRTSLQTITSTHLDFAWISKFLTYKREMKKQYLKDPDIWEKRPLSQLLLNYACGDVRVLFPLYTNFTTLFTSSADRQYMGRGNRAQLTAYRNNTAPQLPDSYELI